MTFLHLATISIPLCAPMSHRGACSHCRVTTLTLKSQIPLYFPYYTESCILFADGTCKPLVMQKNLSTLLLNWSQWLYSCVVMWAAIYAIRASYCTNPSDNSMWSWNSGSSIQLCIISRTVSSSFFPDLHTQQDKLHECSAPTQPIASTTHIFGTFKTTHAHVCHSTTGCTDMSLKIITVHSAAV